MFKNSVLACGTKLVDLMLQAADLISEGVGVAQLRS
jgi:hypothetical protein